MAVAVRLQNGQAALQQDAELVNLLALPDQELTRLQVDGLSPVQAVQALLSQ